jgi:hypothetical protein
MLRCVPLQISEKESAKHEHSLPKSTYCIPVTFGHTISKFDNILGLKDCTSGLSVLIHAELTIDWEFDHKNAKSLEQKPSKLNFRLLLAIASKSFQQLLQKHRVQWTRNSSCEKPSACKGCIKTMGLYWVWLARDLEVNWQCCPVFSAAMPYHHIPKNHKKSQP